MAACGLNASEVGVQIDLDKVINASVAMRFRGTGLNNGDEKDLDFEPLSNPPVGAGTDPSAAGTGRQTPRRSDTNIGETHVQ